MLFPQIVVPIFIQTRSMQLFSQGLAIVKNLLKKNARMASQAIIEYDESCANSYIESPDQQTLQMGFIDTLHETLAECLHDAKPHGLSFKGPQPANQAKMISSIAKIYAEMLRVSENISFLVQSKSLLNDLAWIFKWNTLSFEDLLTDK